MRERMRVTRGLLRSLLFAACAVLCFAAATWALTGFAAGANGFFSQPKDIPAGAYWWVTNDHGSEARDLMMMRWDGGKWTPYKSGVSDTKANESHLAFGVPIYAVADGEVMTCWRNAPENPYAGAVLPERDGCADESEPKDGNMCEHYEQCSCKIPRSGNHLNVRMSDGTTILYAHLKSGSIPAALCPKNGVYVENANDTSGPNGFYDDIWVPEGRRPKVKKGQFIGQVGNNGASGGPHLHIHKAACDKRDCESVPLNFSGLAVSQGVDKTKDASGQVWKLLSPYGSLSGPPQLIKFGQVLAAP